MHFKLHSCDFDKWLSFEAWPFEQAAFILLGYEPPSLDSLRPLPDYMSVPDTCDYPSDYGRMCTALSQSIEHRTIPFKSVLLYPYTTYQVTPRDLVIWAEKKGFIVPDQLAPKVEISSPDWNHWGRMHRAELWEYVALTCDIEPRKTDHRRLNERLWNEYANKMDCQQVANYQSRIDIALSWLGTDRLQQIDGKDAAALILLTVFFPWVVDEINDIPLQLSQIYSKFRYGPLKAIAAMDHQIEIQKESIASTPIHSMLKGAGVAGIDERDAMLAGTSSVSTSLVVEQTVAPADMSPVVAADALSGAAKDLAKTVSCRLAIGHNELDCIKAHVARRAFEIFNEGQITTGKGIGDAIAKELEDGGYRSKRGNPSGQTITRLIPAGLTGGRSKNGKKTENSNSAHRFKATPI